MPCNISANSLNPPTLAPPIGDFGIPISAPKIPFPDINIPTDILETLQDLVSQLTAIFPSGVFTPNINEFTRTVLDAISDLLSQIAPFLSFYNFIMALFKLIVCVIEVLCAIPNPFKIAAAMVKLFRECLPPFLALFPFIALIIMIISLLLLILALIEYIIAAILAFIEEIIRNLTILAEGVALQSAEATLAATTKIANLFCLIENILAIFAALAAILAIIQALATIAGGAICDDDNPTGCCSADVCPPFIKENGFSGTTGQLIYNRQIGVDVASALSLPPDLAAMFEAAIPPVREERWQLLDTAIAPAHKFAEIITPVLDLTQTPPAVATFWPEGLEFDSETPPNKSPYTVDIRLQLDPSTYVPTDVAGSRYFRIKDCVVVRKPYLGTYPYNLPQFPVPGNTNGTLNIEGGLVYEDDDTPYMIGDAQATLNTFIYQTPLSSTSVPTSDDSIRFNNVEFTLKPQHGALMGYTLITAGCMPEVSLEKAITNNVIIAEDVRPVILKLPNTPDGAKVPSTGILPNVTGAQQCVLNALTNFRKDVSIANAAVFQAEMETCLGDLRNQSLAAYCGAVAAAVSQFKSTMVLDTPLQFTTRPITTTVTLNDPSGINVALKMPESCQATIADKLKATISLGEISKFSYDTSGVFKAQITSAKPGQGELRVSFDSKVFNTLTVGVGNVSTIDENVLTYSFVDALEEPAVRRDASDVANEG